MKFIQLKPRQSNPTEEWGTKEFFSNFPVHIPRSNSVSESNLGFPPPAAAWAKSAYGQKAKEIMDSL